MKRFSGCWKRSERAKIVFASILTAFFVALSAHDAYSHKVHVFAWIEGDTIHTQGYFSGKHKARQALIEVFDKGGNKLLYGRTNEKGEFSFKIPKKTDLRIILTTATGHRSDFVISENEIEEASGKHLLSERGPRSADEALLEKSTGKVPKEPISPTRTVELTADEINAIVEKALDTKLSPLIQLMSESKRHGPSLTEILGGIGYIFGIMGVFLYFKSRKK